MPARVLISDKLDPLSAEIFRKKGVEVDYKPGLPADELKKVIAGYGFHKTHDR